MIKIEDTRKGAKPTSKGTFDEHSGDVFEYHNKLYLIVPVSVGGNKYIIVHLSESTPRLVSSQPYEGTLNVITTYFDNSAKVVDATLVIK